MSLQDAKAVVRAFYEALDTARPEETANVMARHTTPEFLWRGFHPFHQMQDAREVGACFWQPLKTSLAHMQRRMDMFIAGSNVIDGGETTWVASMGHLMGLFDAPWLGIRPTRKIAMLRYAAFHRVEGDRIAEQAMYFDIPHLMMQAGLSPFPPQTGAHLVQPGPMPHDGLLFDPQPAAEGVATIAAIDSMIAQLREWQNEVPIETELRLTWHDDMLWWGPAGIGATYTIPRYVEQHARPFRTAFSSRRFNGHVAKIGEGNYGGFFGWPNLTLEHAGGFMGMPGTGQSGDMRVIDMYRRRGDKLAENWIFIDLLHFWKQQGVDILARTTGITGPD